LGQVPCGGNNGVSLTLDPSEKYLIVANYRSSNVAVLPVATDGSLGQPVQIFQLTGTPHPLRRVGHQDNPYPHDVVFDPSGRYLFAVDKGLDGISIFRFENEQLSLHGFVAARGGTGPRHIAFDPGGEWAWVCNELESSVAAYRWSPNDGSLSQIDIVSTLPPDYVGETTNAEIAFHAGTRTLFVSNRGHDSVAMFRSDRRDGSLKPIGWQMSGGEEPRYFGIDPTQRLLYVANEKTDTIVPFAISPQDGRLTQTGKPIANASPVAIAFTTTPKD
jgi:6-phosphogluconolactonase (cycloisomerase 2 family)